MQPIYFCNPKIQLKPTKQGDIIGAQKTKSDNPRIKTT
jgi:hypothetical protein